MSQDSQDWNLCKSRILCPFPKSQTTSLVAWSYYIDDWQPMQCEPLAIIKLQGEWQTSGGQGTKEISKFHGPKASI